jgi:hypothetical protein
MKRFHPFDRRRRVLGTVLWSLAAVGAAMLAVETSRTGLDILVLVMLAAGIVILERTIGDWLGELIGSGLSTFALALVLGAAAWTVFTPGGEADRFFREAHARGYDTLYYRSPDPAPPPAAQAAPTVPVSTAGSSRRASGAPVRRAVDPAPAAEPPPDAGRETSSGLFPTVQSMLAPKVPMAAVTFLDLPTVALTGEQVSIRAGVTLNSRPVAGVRIEFTLNGRSLGNGLTGADGIARIPSSMRVPGRYTIGAVLQDGPSFRGSSTAATITVLPGRSQ